MSHLKIANRIFLPCERSLDFGLFYNFYLSSKRFKCVGNGVIAIELEKWMTKIEQGLRYTWAMLHSHENIINKEVHNKSTIGLTKNQFFIIEISTSSFPLFENLLPENMLNLSL